jgi:hypothetical protein
VSHTIDEQIALLQALKAGKKLQCQTLTHPKWVDSSVDLLRPNFDPRFMYRIKPEPRTWWLVLRADGTVASGPRCDKEKAEQTASTLNIVNSGLGNKPYTIVEVREVLGDESN